MIGYLSQIMAYDIHSLNILHTPVVQRTNTKATHRVA